MNKKYILILLLCFIIGLSGVLQELKTIILFLIGSLGIYGVPWILDKIFEIQLREYIIKNYKIQFAIIFSAWICAYIKIFPEKTEYMFFGIICGIIILFNTYYFWKSNKTKKKKKNNQI